MSAGTDNTPADRAAPRLPFIERGLFRAFSADGDSRFSVLAWRIILFNMLALLVLIAGVIVVQSSRVGLIDERLDGIKEQAVVMAGTLAEYTTDEATRAIKVDQAEPLLRQLIAPTRLRARLYGTNGKLEIDTRNLLARNIIQTSMLPPIGFWATIKNRAMHFYDAIMGVRPFAQLQPYFEAGNDGRVYSEVNQALDGTIGTAKRVDERNKLVLSVAVPVQRFKAIYGVLMLSTESGDIDAILREERATLLEVFFVAFVVMLISSLYLAGAIAQPIRRLAAAADSVRSGRSGREAIPPMTGRNDEIGDLAASLSGMTQALYDRIDAIESFAADVAHELKNPLTSLKSATEMAAQVKDEDARDKLLAIVRKDVKRIDRLITDISAASRLDAELSREESAPIDLAYLLSAIVEVYELMENSRNVAVKLDMNLPAGTRIMGREERIGQVFRNLIDNAVSFSPKGGTVAVSAQKIDNVARIIVDDDGPGIPSGNLETIFNRFYTERPSEFDFGKNSGLGLSIARQIAQGAGGRIWAENRPGTGGKIGGTRLVVDLPIISLARTGP